MSEALKRFQSTIPKSLDPEFNRVLLALLTAIASSDDRVATAIDEGKKQLFIRTASGKNLDKAAASLGVERPPTLGLSDADFQELIPNLSLKPKNIRKAFYDTADIFWGPRFTRANVTSDNSAPFDISAGDVLTMQIDGRDAQTIKVLSTDVDVDGVATAEETIAILNKIRGVTATIITDEVTNDEFINIRTNTPGPTGSVTFLSSTLLSSTKLDFTVGSYDVLSLDQRVVVYHLTDNRLLIELPSIVPALRRSLKGSHHLHETSAIEPEVAPLNGVWAGSFLFNPSGTVGTVTVLSQRCELQQTITKGQVYTAVSVDDNELFEETSGEIIFGFGTTTQEGPVKYRGIPNSNTILLDPSYTFQNTHASGTIINVISAQEPYIPVRNGKDLAIYLTSPSDARAEVQLILSSLVAAGILIDFVILAPSYKYLVDNPYITDDDAPSAD